MYFLFCYERIYITHNVRRVQAAHDLNFVERLHAHFLGHFRHIYGLDNIMLVLQQVATLRLRAALASRRLLGALLDGRLGLLACLASH